MLFPEVFTNYLEDQWDWFVAEVSHRVPSEWDYVEENWTHEKIARVYALIVHASG